MSYKNRVRKNVSEGSNPSLSGVRDYIQDENNGVYINGAYLGAAWQFRTDYKGSQDCKDCKEDRKKKNFGITKKKYIYLKP